MAKDKHTQTHTHTQTETHTQGNHADTQRDRHTHRHRHRHTDTHTHTQTETHTPKATTQTHRETHQKVRTKQARKFLTVSVYKINHLKLFSGLCGGDLSRDTRQSTHGQRACGQRRADENEILNENQHRAQARRACPLRSGNGAQTRTTF